MHYRPEIDGLRAIAVVAVIAAHAGAPLSGGFLGVDIFFVISGFLITTILVRELAEGRFSLARFYERRARRILPALIVVALACLPAAWALMPPEQLKQFGQSLVALALFATNFLFWDQAGYFAPASEEIPMLHTWSLAVEEQFYLLFPLALMLLVQPTTHHPSAMGLGPMAALHGGPPPNPLCNDPDEGGWAGARGGGWQKQPAIFQILAMAALASLIAAEAAARLAPSAAFYLLPFRAWELLAGSLAALAVLGHGPDPARLDRWRGALSLTGLGLIGASLVFYHRWLPVPGVWLVAPVGGTVLVLLYGTAGTWACRVLSARVPVTLGLISYSAYLWHQPLFAFARIGRFDPPAAWQMAGLVALTFLLAWATWAVVEQPFRKRVPLCAMITGMGLGGAGLAALGLAAHLNGGFAPERFGPEARALLSTTTPSPKRGACHGAPRAAPAPEEACIYFADAPPGWAVFGDSHAVEIAYGLAEHLSARGESLVHLSASGCPPALAFETPQPGCTDWVGRSVDWLAGQRGLHTVVLVWRHSAYLHGQNSHDYPVLPDTPYKISGPGDAAAKRARYWASMATIVRRLKTRARRVIVLAPIPEIARHIDKYTLFRMPDAGPLPTIPRAYYQARNAETFAGLERLGHLGAEIVPVAPVLCDARTCYGSRAGQALYFDDDHLSIAGARLVATALLEDGPGGTLALSRPEIRGPSAMGQ